MAQTFSNSMELGKKAPDFNLIDVVSGNQISLNEAKGDKGLVVLFICNHCPFVIHVNALLVRLANEYKVKGINFVAISSNDVDEYPQDGPEFMKKVALENQYPFPYLYDEYQEVAKAYDATCTPDVFVFDKNLTSFYHGQLDKSRPGNGIPSTGDEIKKVLDTLLIDKVYLESISPSMGCGIKWKS
ncbi:MAG: thioredoxin family protein [Wenyingzhuangia sp.]|uniref:thioredoxin family protein n=1 Tax=Wenyingzhuangia sp. TaxID=1964193 RepID=UPI003219D3CF